MLGVVSTIVLVAVVRYFYVQHTTQRCALVNAVHALELAESAQQGACASDPVVVATPAVIDRQAEQTLCVQCGGEHRLIEHSAVTVHGVRLRCARLQCRQCGQLRERFFEIRSALTN